MQISCWYAYYDILHTSSGREQNEIRTDERKRNVRRGIMLSTICAAEQDWMKLFLEMSAQKGECDKAGWIGEKTKKNHTLSWAIAKRKMRRPAWLHMKYVRTEHCEPVATKKEGLMIQINDMKDKNYLGKNAKSEEKQFIQINLFWQSAKSCIFVSTEPYIKVNMVQKASFSLTLKMFLLTGQT